MATIVDLRTEVVHRAIFELRYAFGHLYWDRCGKIINRIISEREEWDYESLEGGTCHLSCREKNLHLNYSAFKLDLVQTQSAEVDKLESMQAFGAIADSFSQTIVETLQLADFPRIGFRVWFLYETADREESYERMKTLRLSALQEDSFGPRTRITETSHRLVVETADHMVRVAVTPFEQTVTLAPGLVRAAHERAKHHSREQKRVLLDKLKAERTIKNYPRFGILLDMDAYIEDPPYPAGISVTDFVESALQSFEAIKPNIMQKRG